jgi:RNA polymerase sigma factor (TIGR02999 family)
MADITAQLQQWRSGDQAAIDSVCAELYKELRGMAANYLHGEGGGRTLQATALVHEVYLRLKSVRDIDWQARGQFLAMVARMMRNMLVDAARRRAVRNRGAGALSIAAALEQTDDNLDFLALDIALEKLASESPRSARVVELRFFGGLDAAECAQAMEVSLSTVEREWRFGRAWLQSAMAG